jgi:hypothetical protein
VQPSASFLAGHASAVVLCTFLLFADPSRLMLLSRAYWHTCIATASLVCEITARLAAITALLKDHA